VLAFTIESTTGALSPVPGSHFPMPGQTVLNSEPLGIVVESTGHFAYAALNATNQISAFSIVSGTGALTPVAGSPFPAGTTPLSVATAGNFLYANSADGTVWGYRIDSTTGALSPVAGSPFPFRAAGLISDPLGTFLYGSSSAGIAAFSINSTTGALTPLAGSPFPAGGAALLTIVKMPSQGG
jgi:6-phosphogluconolactonase (cycloisomerase 2 family)